jgi:hypothetical protein
MIYAKPRSKMYLDKEVVSASNLTSAAGPLAEWFCGIRGYEGRDRI